MAGYTPIFDSVFQGSLCGKYPDLPVWLVLLALQQRGGMIDAHPSYIATVSGIPQADIESAIERFCEPDPSSRTPDHDGRRLEPLDGRGFGWRVLNHEKYREKARKQDYDRDRTASGKDAERKAESRAVPRSPDESRDLPLSEAEAEASKRYVGLKSDIRAVFDHWRTVHGHPQAKLDSNREGCIERALKKHKFSVEQLKCCIDGFKRSEFHQGGNKDHKVFDGLTMMLRNSEQIEKGIEFTKVNGGPQKWL